MLLVVGRYDTGQLEAQVRGSRHAWDMRLISVDSLVNLVNLKEATEDESTSSKIRSILIPMEYTRLDRLIDVMFTTAKDVENTMESDVPRDETDEVTQAEKGTWVFTESAIINGIRSSILRKLGAANNAILVKKSPALYWNSERSVGIACTVSKKYDKNDLNYWYAYHNHWDEFLAKANKAFFALGCVDLEIAFAIPYEVIHKKLPELNTTRRDGKVYWHIKVKRTDERFYLLCPSSGEHLDLTPYTIELGSLT